MADNIDVVSLDVFPPTFEIFLRDIERGRGDEVIEDDVVLLTPAERSDVIQIIVVKKFTRDRFRRHVRRPVDELRCEEQTQSRELRELVQHRLADLRREALSDGIYVLRDPLVVFRTVDPRRDVSAFFHLRRERQKCFFWIWCVMEHADAECVVE